MFIGSEEGTCPQSLIFCVPQVIWSYLALPQPGLASRCRTELEGYSLVRLNPLATSRHGAISVLTCLPVPGPSRQTASAATWEGMDGQMVLSRRGTKARGGCPPDGDQKWDLLVFPHLSICSGVWAFWVSATSQLRPVIHRLMSSSQKAGGRRRGW